MWAAADAGADIVGAEQVHAMAATGNVVVDQKLDDHLPSGVIAVGDVFRPVGIAAAPGQA